MFFFSYLLAVGLRRCLEEVAQAFVPGWGEQTLSIVMVSRPPWTGFPDLAFWLLGCLYGRGEVWAVVGERGVSLVGMGKHDLESWGRASNSYCLPHSAYSPEENVLLVLFPPLLRCADSVLFILNCSWNKYVGDFKPLHWVKTLKGLHCLCFLHSPANMLRASVFLPRDAVPQLDWMFLSASGGLCYELTLAFVDARSRYMTWPFVSASF